MNIKGFQGTSLLDFPGRVASLIFWGGCNLTCPFCHNPALVLDPQSCPDIEPDDVLQELAHRQPFIDGVVVSGGEPTINKDLIPFLERVKGLGLAVKVDTNGLVPEVIETLLARQLVDYLAIDLKASAERYADLHPGPVTVERLFETLALCRDCDVDVEYRTTCVPGWVDEAMIHSWGERIAGSNLWALQQFHPEYALDDACRDQQAYPPEYIRELAVLAGDYVQEVIVRGL